MLLVSHFKQADRKTEKHAGWTISEKIYKSLKYQTGRLSHKIEEDGKKSWLRRAKLYRELSSHARRKRSHMKWCCIVGW